MAAAHDRWPEACRTREALCADAGLSLYAAVHRLAGHARYFIELNVATANDRERAVCRSPWFWIGRRLP